MEYQARTTKSQEPQRSQPASSKKTTTGTTTNSENTSTLPPAAPVYRPVHQNSNPQPVENPLLCLCSQSKSPIGAHMPIAPKSTVEKSRFFPGGRPAPGLISRGYIGGQGKVAAEKTPVSVASLAQHGRSGSSSKEYSQEQGTGTNALRPRRVANLDELEKKAPSPDACRRLQGTRPAGSWVNGLESWRRNDAVQQQPSQNPAAKTVYSPASARHVQQQSFLSALAPEFQTNPQADALPALPAPAPPGAQSSGNFAAGGHQPTHLFRPMNTKLNPLMGNRPLTREEMEFRKAHGISENYQGEAFNPQNISANIPDSENCALFLTNLPPNCSYRDLLAAVAEHQPGRVWSTYITPPDARSDRSLPSYRTSAAKIIFYAPEEASRLLQAASFSTFKVLGYRVVVRRNRIKTPAQPSEKSQTSRCLIISGPKHIVDELQLRELFDQYFAYEAEGVILLEEKESSRSLEWRFSSYRAQAGAAFSLLRSTYGFEISVKFAQDPCAGSMG